MDEVYGKDGSGSVGVGCRACLRTPISAVSSQTVDAVSAGGVVLRVRGRCACRRMIHKVFAAVGAAGE